MIKNTLGLKNGIPISIHDLDKTIYNGLKCGCICPDCGMKFIAVQGSIREPHFRHEAETECAYNGESIVHLLGKEVLNENRYFNMPAYEGFDIENLEFSNVILEKSNGIKGFIFDIIGFSKNENLYIELFYRHNKSYEDIEKLKARNITCIEVDISDVDKSLSISKLKEVLIELICKSTEKKKYLSTSNVFMDDINNKKQLISFERRFEKEKKELHSLYIEATQKINNAVLNRIDVLKDDMNWYYRIKHIGNKGIDVKYYQKSDNDIYSDSLNCPLIRDFYYDNNDSFIKNAINNFIGGYYTYLSGGKYFKINTIEYNYDKIKNKYHKYIIDRIIIYKGKRCYSCKYNSPSDLKCKYKKTNINKPYYDNISGFFNDY